MRFPFAPPPTAQVAGLTQARPRTDSPPVANSIAAENERGNVTTIVVVGAGLAGVRTVERLRARGFDGRLVLLGAEFRLPYDRPPLSKEVLRGTRQESLLRSLADYDRLNAELRCGQRATGVDVGRRVVQLEDNEVRRDYRASRSCA